jgi:uroporphyrinogen III methyltransferase/synthase
MLRRPQQKKEGIVFLVGAGPGDPGLITVKGLNCIKEAEVIIYDRLIDNSLLDAARADAEKIYVGKGQGYHAREQKEINLLLLAKAREGKTVARLKGGDPFVLGRGGEEAEILAQNGIPFEVIPGVSSAYAVPAYAGIPVTDRRLASSFMVLTGHEDANKAESTILWDKVSTGSDTLIILMGVGNLASIVTHLVNNARPANTPAAIISNGTSPQQRTIVGTLGDIIDRANEEGIKAPAVIVVGEVVKLRENLRWFDNLPLFGKRILVTRPKKQVKEISQLLRERGALTVEMPVIKIVPPQSWTEFDQAIKNIKGYGWILFTSVNAVEMFFKRLHFLNLDSRCLGGIRIGAIGPATARALEGHGIRTDYVPRVYTSQGLIAGFGRKSIAGQKVFLSRADIASKELSDGLSNLGAEVLEVTVYRTIVGSGNSLVKKMLLKGEIDVITFTSASTVNNLIEILSSDWQIIKKAKLAAIGPNTSSALKQRGLKPDIMASEHTIPGLVDAIEQYYQAEVVR